MDGKWEKKEKADNGWRHKEDTKQAGTSAVADINGVPNLPVDRTPGILCWNIMMMYVMFILINNLI